MLCQSALELYTQSENEEQHIAYGLSPSILYANRQAYEEASGVLYGGNTLHIYCFGLHSYYWWNREYVCPLQRYYPVKYWNCSPPHPLLEEASASKVRHWKIIVSSNDTG
jgi:hypothetical protein